MGDAVIRVRMRQDMVRFVECLENRTRGRHSASKCGCSSASLKRGSRSFQHLSIRIAIANILMTSWVTTINRPLKGGGKVDWRGDRSCPGVDTMARVNCQSFNSHRPECRLSCDRAKAMEPGWFPPNFIDETAIVSK